MDQYVTGSMIRRLREQRKMTQLELAAKLSVSDKTISKWETGRGYPDISMLTPLADALGISVIELLSGSDVCNSNRSFNMKRSRFYVCPVCANVITAAGEAVVSCCGITLPPLEAEEPDEAHRLIIEPAEDEYYVSLAHPMTKTHYISFLAAVTDSGVELKKLYPEGAAEARFKVRGLEMLYYCCNRHGFFRQKIRRNYSGKK